MAETILLTDISNGLYMKVALAERGERPGLSTHYACETLDEFKSALRDFLERCDNPSIKGAALSAGGWEEHGVMAMPNHRFRVSRNEMRDFLGVQRLNLVNDCVAKALAIPRLGRDEKIRVCGGEEMEEQVIALINSHNGLGQAGLAPDGMGNYTAMPCEGGHSDLTCVNELEFQVMKGLSKKYGHVSRERVISFPGIADIFAVLSDLEKDEPLSLSPEEVIARAAGGDDRALKAINLSMGWLAVMASDVALILGARGGVYLAGEYLDAVGDLFDADAFAARYHDKGRLRDYVGEIPVYRATAEDMEVIGLATLFD
jgi:glucokinase